jgi:8-oxo-dGTP diphosphatase
VSGAIHVVAGVLRDAQGRVLLAQRPPGKHLAGLWEFPGGKCEPGENPCDALRRELHEELGIAIGAAEKLIAVPWQYAEKCIYLDVYNVPEYQGAPQGRECQALRWVEAQALDHVPMPAADRPVVNALQLPRQYTISPEPEETRDFLAAARRALGSGARLMQLRSKRLSDEALRPLAKALQQLAIEHGAALLINNRAALAEELALGGVHLSAAELMRATRRPLPDDFWVGASCHDNMELGHAAKIGVDFAVLGPVQYTQSHPSRIPLGWNRFAELCTQAPFPVFALGGLGVDDVPSAIAAGAQGVAGISAFWPQR